MAAQRLRQKGHHGARFAMRPGAEDDGRALPLGAHGQRNGAGPLHFRGRDGLLTIHPGGARLAADLPPDAVWLDLLEGTEEEKEAVARATGFRVPTLESLQEIESSSRMAAEGEVLYLSLPVIAHAGEDRPVLTPLGIVLSPHHLLTVRFAAVGAVEAMAARPGPPTDSFGSR